MHRRVFLDFTLSMEPGALSAEPAQFGFDLAHGGRSSLTCSPSCSRHAPQPAKRLRVHPELPRHLGDRWRLAQAQRSAPELLAKRLRSSPLHATVLPRI